MVWLILDRRYILALALLFTASYFLWGEQREVTRHKDETEIKRKIKIKNLFIVDSLGVGINSKSKTNYSR